MSSCNDCVKEQGVAINVPRLGAAVILVLAAYLLLKKIGFVSLPSQIDGAVGLSAIFFMGLMAAFSSCTAVVGGLLVAVSSASAVANTASSFRKRAWPHILFNLGRLAGFATFGALIGWFGSVFTLTPIINSILIIFVAVIMFVIGVQLLGIISFTIQPLQLFASRIHKLAASRRPAMPFLFGALTFFLPCGFTQATQFYALATGDPARAAIIMFVFALGTMPALLGVGVLTSWAKGVWLRGLARAAGVFVLTLGLINAQNGFNILGLGVSKKNVESALAAEIIDGAQVVRMRVGPDLAYNPEIIRVVEDVSVRWMIEGSVAMGCASSLILSRFGVATRLRPGMNEVTFTPTEVGAFRFTCSMGMTRGTLIVEEHS